MEDDYNKYIVNSRNSWSYIFWIIQNNWWNFQVWAAFTKIRLVWYILHYVVKIQFWSYRFDFQTFELISVRISSLTIFSQRQESSSFRPQHKMTPITSSSHVLTNPESTKLDFFPHEIFHLQYKRYLPLLIIFYLRIKGLQMKWSPISFAPLTFLVPRKFGPREIWALRSVVPKKWLFHGGLTLLGDQISWGPKKLGAQMRSGTISAIANQSRL